MRNHVISKDLLDSDYQYRRLHDEHEKIEERINRMRASPATDTTSLYELKRLKLKVRDQMSTLEKMRPH